MNHIPTSICVYCASSPGNRPEYRQVAWDIGVLLAQKGIRLVYGGGHIGLMGVLADGALSAGGTVIGVIPRMLVERELGHPGITELHVVRDMHERKTMMASLADAFIALPGGWGTLEELTEMVTWNQLGLHTKPIGLLNVRGYYDPFVQMVEAMVAEAFVRPDDAAILRVESDPETLLKRLSAAA